MVTRIVGCLFMVGLLASACATTDGAINLNTISPEEVAAYNADPNNTDKIICKDEKPIGSSITRRNCYMESSLDDAEREGARAIEEVQRQTRMPGE